MSFITKRERVFNDYELLNLPARNEGKLKTYASCTDTRAWSHFCSDQTEHLVDIIKRNNETCRIKYVPTDVIVNTLMVAKNAEIGRLKHKIEEFEQMLAAYDQLDLTSEQKVEIANAHAAIKAANKELDELCLDLDLSGFTEGVDSEAFETGKSRGDELGRFRGDEIDRLRPNDVERHRTDDWFYEKQPKPLTSEKGNQIELSGHSDASTNVHDPRIQDMQDTIISKDAKLSAMQNTIAVMENDVCEPYCIYAHIYTAIEKIFGILCQNDKYKLYLNLMTAGKDTRCIDIKGKILFKLKVLEKFSLALIAPCSQEPTPRACSCYRVEISQHVQSTFALASSQSQQHCLENKRAHLVADIIENEEMKELLSKERGLDKMDDDQSSDNMGVDNYDIETENLKRLKNLQANYDDLVACYENLKHDRDCLQIKSKKYEELEKDYEVLRSQLREYNLLWNEKEHYRKRSEDIDSLKEQYLILTDETTNLETQLKAESEINHMKTNTIEDLRNENISLNKKFNDALLAFEKEKNLLQCKLKETECKEMCQEQQIKSLSLQIDRLLEQDKIKTHEDPTRSLLLIEEIESLKDEIKNLKNALFCNEDEKHALQEEFQEKLKDINELRMTIEDWKSIYEKLQQRNNYVENYAQNYDDELHRFIEENRSLCQELEEKRIDVKNKSLQIKKLMDEIENDKIENSNLFKRLIDIEQAYDRNVVSVENEKKQALQCLDLTRKESQKLISKVKDYDDMVQKYDNISKCFEDQVKDYNELKNDFLKTIEENKNLTYELHNSRSSHERLLLEKKTLEIELQQKTRELADTIECAQILKKETQDLSAKLQQSENLTEELRKVNEAYKNVTNDNLILQNQLSVKSKEINDLLQILNNIKEENNNLLQQSEQHSRLEQELNNIRKAHDELIVDRNLCQHHLDNKTDEINNLNNILKNKVNEISDLLEQIKCLENNQEAFNNNISAVQNENIAVLTTLDAIKIESTILIDKINNYETLESEFEDLKLAYNQLKTEKERLQNELEVKMTDFRKIELENNELHRDSQTLLRHSENLEKILTKPDASQDPYSTIIEEIEDMKKEKQLHHRRIRELLDKLDESDIIISNLHEDILVRDDKIAILENHINELKDEVTRLHEDLAQIVDAGEEIQKSSYEKIDQSLKKMQAHHSRATHDMKMELMKLQDEKSLLEDQLSTTKLKTEESAMDEHNYLTQITHLRNEKEIIITDIKQLELESVGDSNLSPINCSVEDILMSLDRIRKIFDAKNSKSNALEQTLLKVQTSSQLLLSEAKAIVEKEKQKILSEKEEAVRDKLNLQNQLEDQKANLEQQISLDKTVIQDLEGEILNQKLIIDKLNKSTQNYIAKLEEELLTLQKVYENSKTKVSELQEKLLHSSEETNTQRAIIEKTNLDLELKSKEITKLQNHLKELKNKPNQNVGIQVSSSDINTANTASQTDEGLKDSELVMFPHFYENNLEDLEMVPVIDGTLPDKPFDDINISSVLPKQKPIPINDVEILAANVDPSFDFVRRNYLQYKLKQLSPGRLEQYSILNGNFTNENDNGQASAFNNPNNDNFFKNTTMENPNLVDIYNRQSLHSNSSKTVFKNTEVGHGLTKSNLSTKLDLTNNSFITDITDITSKYQPDSSTEKLTDKDFFIIYKDSEPYFLDKMQNEKEIWYVNGQSEVLIESLTDHSQKEVLYTNKYNQNSTDEGNNKTQIDICYDEEEKENTDEEDDDSVKPKLDINLPRVVTDSLPLTSLDDDNKSLDSYTMNKYGNQITLSDFNESKNHGKLDVQDNPSLPILSNDDNQCKDTSKLLKDQNQEYKIGLNSKEQKYDSSEINNKLIKHSVNKNDRKTPNKMLENESHHKLSRVEADVFLIMPENNLNKMINYNKNSRPHPPRKASQNFGLQYILNTVQREINPEVNATKMLRKTHSDENINKLKLQYAGSNSSQSPPLKLSSFEFKTDSSYSHTASKTSDQSHSKSFVERSIMAKIDNTQEHEAKLVHLTKVLENTEKEYKKKIEVIKIQYDNNIKNIINEHNQGVKNIQYLHEETLQDIIKIHENEVESLRSLSIEAMRKSDKLEKENQSLKSRIEICSCSCFNEETFKMPPTDTKRRKKSRTGATLTKTNVEAFDVNPKSRSHGPCTCSLNVNVSNMIRNIFEQVDVEQRKMAEHSYMKYIIKKIVTKNVEALDTQELSFLHLKVCRIWKMKLSREESIKKGIGTLEHEVMNEQRNAQQYIAELDRQVSEEKRRLQEVREAVCCSTTDSHSNNPNPETQPKPPATAENNLLRNCNVASSEIGERQSAGDLIQPGLSKEGFRPRRIREMNRAVLAQLDVEERREKRLLNEERREKRLYNDEPPTRLRRAHGTGSERTNVRTHKK